MYLVHGPFVKTSKYCEDLFGKDYFEFCLSYVGDGAGFREIDRFLWESRHERTRYRNRYSGPVALDITAWADKYPNDYFDAFMYFISDAVKEGECVLTSEEKCGREICDRLGRFFTLEVISLNSGKESAGTTRKIGFTDEKEDEKDV